MEHNLFQLVLGWRGFLLPHRRFWHSHHQPRLLGFRGGFLVVRMVPQLDTLRRASGLVQAVFNRGGRLWGFGMTTQTHGWGRTFADWIPGVLSNSCHAARVRRRTRAAALVLDPPPYRRVRSRRRVRRRRVRSRRRRRRTRLSRRGQTSFVAWFMRTAREARNELLRVWTRRRGVHTRRRYEWYPVEPAAGGATRAWSRALWGAACHLVNPPRGRRRRPRRRAAGVIRRPRVPPRRPGRWSWSPTRLALAVRRRFRRRPRRQRRRFSRLRSRWNRTGHFFPGVVVGAGLTRQGVSLVTEVNAVGLPFVHLHDARWDPAWSGWGVLWAAPTEGLPLWWSALWAQTVRTAAFRVVWARLGGAD